MVNQENYTTASAGIQRSLFDFSDNNNPRTGKPNASSTVVMPPCNPFVKWAGGKGQLLTQLYNAATI